MTENSKKCDCETLAGMKAHTMECVFGNKKPTETWREEFGALWKKHGLHLGYANDKDRHIKTFIAQKLEEAREVAYKKGLDHAFQAAAHIEDKLDEKLRHAITGDTEKTPRTE
jgi:hypothetical protein